MKKEINRYCLSFSTFTARSTSSLRPTAFNPSRGDTWNLVLGKEGEHYEKSNAILRLSENSWNCLSRENGNPKALRKLDNFDFLIIDDLGYLPQGTEESEVLFTLIAERYERRSLGITSNLLFSEWDRLFQNPMATAAAIDRVVHHSVILEFSVPSYRTAAAQQRNPDNKNDQKRKEGNRQI